MTLPLIVAALAVYRLSRMVAWEDGPGRVFARLREKAATDYDQEGEPSNFWGALLSCPLCLSVWLGLILGPLVLLWPAVTMWILMPFALSGAATVILSREE